MRSGDAQNNLSSKKRQVDLARQMSLLRAATKTKIDEDLSPTNVTVIHGENALLVCTIMNIGDKSVSFKKKTNSNLRNNISRFHGYATLVQFPSCWP